MSIRTEDTLDVYTAYKTAHKLALVVVSKDLFAFYIQLLSLNEHKEKNKGEWARMIDK